MTVARRLESRIRTLNLFVTFIRQLALTYKFLNNLVLAFPKCSLPFLCFQYYRSDFDNILFNKVKSERNF